MTKDISDLSRSLGIDAKVYRLTLVLGPLLWGMGLIFSRTAGCGWDQAAFKATAYAASGLVGWGIYLLVREPSPWSWGELFFVWNSAGLINLSLLQPTRTPWPFPAMLAHGVIFVTTNMLLAALVVRWIKGRRRLAT